MRWLRRSGAAHEAAREDGSGAEGSEIEPAAHDSPALAEIFSGLDTDQPMRVLDLGAALRVNLERYSTFANGVRIAHLLRDADSDTLQTLDSRAFVQILERLSPVGEESFGLILAWDLLNYLVDDQPKILAHHLAAVADHGARIHAMTLTTETMPSEPSRYEFVGSGGLIYHPTTQRRTDAPNPTPAQVERWLNPFRVEHSFLLRHGVREFIAVNE